MFNKKQFHGAEMELFRRTALEAADALDLLRADNKQLILRGRRLAEAVMANDGTVESAWRISDALAAWAEYDQTVASE